MNTPDFVTLKDVMVAPPITVDGLATVRQAIELMQQHDVGSLVVDRRYAGDEYGMVDPADLAKAVVAKDRAPERVNVYEVMTKPVIGLDAGMNIRYALRLLERLGLRRALVLEDNMLVGIVSLRRLVLKMLNADSKG